MQLRLAFSAFSHRSALQLLCLSASAALGFGACGSETDPDQDLGPSLALDANMPLGEAGLPHADDAGALPGSDGAVTPQPGLDASSALDAGVTTDAASASDAAPATDATSSTDATLGSDAGTDASADAGGATDTALCTLKGSQVGVLGDSYIALDVSYIGLDNFPFVENLESLARAAGALKMGQGYRRLAQSGASMNGEPNIPAQLDRTLMMDKDLKLIVMTGGGNDVLVNNRDCLEFATEAELTKNAKCVKVVEDAVAAGQKMFDVGAAAGVKAVVYFFYPHLPGLANGGIGAGGYPNVMLDYAYPKVKAMCDRQTAARCYFVDMRPAFDQDKDGLPDQGLINLDGIHPTGTSSPILAKEVWKVMQEHCLASKP